MASFPVTSQRPAQTVVSARSGGASDDATALGTLLGVAGALLSVWLIAGGIGMAAATWCAPDPERAERERVASLGVGGNLDVDAVAHGKMTFVGTCAACHGADAHGLPGRGKNLAVSEFLARQSDEALAAFIAKGRPATDPLNTTKLDMPPKGGNATLTDGDVEQVVKFLRAVQNPRRVSASKLALVESKLQEEEAKAEAARAAAKASRLAEKAAAKQVAQAAAPVAGAAPSAAEEEDDPETIALGGQVFAAGCSSCHGANALGLPNNGKDLIHSKFAKGLSDEDLIAFIKRGRDPGDPLNTTKIAMPPKGGNPALNDEKLEAVVAYIRSIQKAAEKQ